MLNIVKEQQDDGSLLIRMSGSIDESTNFKDLIGEVPEKVDIYCKQIPRINSDGIKKWVEYFQGLSNNGTKLRFFECSTAITEQMSLISNFRAGGSVESVYVPFVCKDCNTELIGLFTTEKLQKIDIKQPKLKCSKCASKNTEFDDITEEYFRFLKRSN